MQLKNYHKLSKNFPQALWVRYIENAIHKNTACNNDCKHLGWWIHEVKLKQVLYTE